MASVNSNTFQALRRAYDVDVARILAKARVEAGGAIDVLAAYRASKWRERKAQERKPVGLGAVIVGKSGDRKAIDGLLPAGPGSGEPAGGTPRGRGMARVRAAAA